MQNGPATTLNHSRKARRAIVRPTVADLMQAPDIATWWTLARAMRRENGKPLNVKTGGMLQTYILRADLHPMEAIATRADSSICGGCPHRGTLDKVTGKMVGRSCYVEVGKGPSGVWKCAVADGYPTCPPHLLGDLLAGGLLRLGSYGDPAAAPAPMWARAVARVAGYTGYTHQWKSARLRDVTTWCQASCDSVADLERARGLGLGTFRVAPVGAEPLAGEVVCPASAEAGKVTTCDQCRMCDGSGRNVVIQAHGNGKGYVARRATLPTIQA
jgi:hypothetical protein